MRILEVGRTPYLAGYFPGSVERFDTSAYENSTPPEFAGLLALLKAIGNESYDLIVCEPNVRRRLDALSRLLFSKRIFSGRPSFSSIFAQQMFRRRLNVPVAVIDIEDHSRITAADRYLLARSPLYFKRELPSDEWRLLDSGDGFAGRSLRSKPSLRAMMDKILPVSLGMSLDAEAFARGMARSRKTSDVFFAGNVCGLPERERGLAELRELAAAGVKVDIPEQRIGRQEFFRRCAEAHLVWSPEGYGWDCFRHHEVAAMASVPVINAPSIRPYRPMRHGDECLYYVPEKGALTRTIFTALENRDALIAMGDAAREHAISFKRRSEIGRYVVNETLSRFQSTVAAARFAAQP
ncbi:hypothetical protein P9272_25155 [Mesorhizobium sp. WSM4976]|uniref:hypothetical protein n=1 Tax=Mesorhizobium sp. WSM4976 TaxID=3038549 RepID=UPI0024170B5A|nr:hypothetical protein [Mesorhizobium sp. WSM4976]MDG4896858.1 hypothetical protein [Mesorhizobium sp. WSM4976]